MYRVVRNNDVQLGIMREAFDEDSIASPVQVFEIPSGALVACVDDGGCS